MFHPATSIVRPLSLEEYYELEGAIEFQGLLAPIVLYEGAILDGRARYKACVELGIEPHFEELTFDDIGGDPIGYLASVNLSRRHLSEEELAESHRRAIELASIATGDEDESDDSGEPAIDPSTPLPR